MAADIGACLLTASQQLVKFARDVLGLELEYVTPDLQGGSGWLAVASAFAVDSKLDGKNATLQHPLLLHMLPIADEGLGTNKDEHAAVLRSHDAQALHHDTVSVEDFLDGIADRCVHTAQHGSISRTTSVATSPAAGPVEVPPQAVPAGAMHVQGRHSNIAESTMELRPCGTGDDCKNSFNNPGALYGPGGQGLPAPFAGTFLTTAVSPNRGILASDASGPQAFAVVACWHPGVLLSDALRQCSCAGSNALDDAQLRLLLLQLLSATAHVHSHGTALGIGAWPMLTALQPSSWLQVLPVRASHATSAAPHGCAGEGPEPVDTTATSTAPGQVQGAPQQQQQQREPRAFPPVQLQLLHRCLQPVPTLLALTDAWRHHAVSNLEYLMLLNLMAGRRLGDRNRHPYVPWVTDFSVPPSVLLAQLPGAAEASAQPPLVAHASPQSSRATPAVPSSAGSLPLPAQQLAAGWHDLSVTKYRQAKGDLQLDFTFSSSDTPHHIPEEPVSELSYCIYLARALPRAVLVRAVRTNFEPREYPATVQQMYELSPDECVPQLYCDPSVFRSVHPELPDLGLPPWCDSPEEFVRMHRELLESPQVSSQLHHWIDLMFGYKLSGQAAVAAKNVHLHVAPYSGVEQAGHAGPGPASCALHGVVCGGGVSRSGGMYQLFRTPHPPRLSRRAALGEVPGATAGQSHLPASRAQHLPGPSAGLLCDLDSLELMGQMLGQEPSNLLAEDRAAAAGAHDGFGSAAAHLRSRKRRPSGGAGSSSSSRAATTPSGAVARDAATTAAVEAGSKEAAVDVMAAQQRDVRSVGALAVQLYLRRLCYAPLDDGAYWLQQAQQLPAAARHFVRRCFSGKASVDGLLADAFFQPWLHATYALLASTLYPCTGPEPDPVLATAAAVPVGKAALSDAAAAAAVSAMVARTSPPLSQRLMQQLQALRQACHQGMLGQLAAQSSKALELCMPHMLAVLWQAMDEVMAGQGQGEAKVGSPQCPPCVNGQHMRSESAAAVVGTQAADAIQLLLPLLQPEQAVEQLLPIVCYSLAGVRNASAGMAAGGLWDGGQHPSPALQVQMLSPALHLALLQALPLQCYCQQVVPLLLALLLSTQHVDAHHITAADGHVRSSDEVHPSMPQLATAGSASSSEPFRQQHQPHPRTSSPHGAPGGLSRALAVVAVSDAASNALLAVVPELPLPLVLERVLQPLLDSIAACPAVPQVLIRLCGELGGPLAARHIVPALLQLALVPAGLMHSVAGASPPSGPGAAAVGTAARAPVPQHTTSHHQPQRQQGPVTADLQQQVYAALGVLAAVLDLLPREALPRMFLHGTQAVSVGGAGATGSAVAAVASLPGVASVMGAAAAAVSTAVTGRPSAVSGSSTSAGGMASGGAAGSQRPPMMAALLDPRSHVVVPGSLSILVQIVLRAFSRLARPENLALVMLPHLMLLLNNPSAARRAAYRANSTQHYPQHSTHHAHDLHHGHLGHGTGRGTSHAAAAAGSAASATCSSTRASTDSDAPPRAQSGHDMAAVGGNDPEWGYWELVHFAYRDLVSCSGLLAVRSLLPGWRKLEEGLERRFGWSAADAEAGAHGTSVASSSVSGSGDFVVGSAGSSGGGGRARHPLAAFQNHTAAQQQQQQRVKQEIATKQQQVMALQVSNLFIKDQAGWSAPNAIQIQARRQSAGGKDPGGSALGAVARSSPHTPTATPSSPLASSAHWPPLLAIGSPSDVAVVADGLAANLSRQASLSVTTGGFSRRGSQGSTLGGGGSSAAAQQQEEDAGLAAPKRISSASAKSSEPLLRTNSNSLSALDLLQRRRSGSSGGAAHIAAAATVPAHGSAASLRAPGLSAMHSEPLPGRSAAGALLVPVPRGVEAASPFDVHHAATGGAGDTVQQRVEGRCEREHLNGAALQPEASSNSNSSGGSRASQRYLTAPCALPEAGGRHCEPSSQVADSSLPGTSGAGIPPTLPITLFALPPLHVDTAAAAAASNDAGAGPSATVSSNVQRWAWVPPATPSPAIIASHVGASPSSCTGVNVASARLLSACRSAGSSVTPWSIQANVLHSWPAHKGPIRALAIHPNEGAVLTAGRGAVGGRDSQAVVRCWSLDACQAYAQYAGHRAPVTALAVVRGGSVAPLAASLDAGGQLHVWRCDNGAQVAAFAPVGASAAAAEQAAAGYFLDVELSGNAWQDLIDRSGHYSHRLQRPSAGGAPAPGWQAMGGLLTEEQLAAETPSPGGRPLHAALPLSAHHTSRATAPGLNAAGGYTTLRVGFTAMAPAPDNQGRIYAGTADSRVCTLDLERGCVASEWLAACSVRYDADDCVQVLAVPGTGEDGFGAGAAAAAFATAGTSLPRPEWLAVGSKAGRVLLLDTRCGTHVCSFKAHGLEVAQLATYGQHTLLTASPERLLKVWDLRRASSSPSTMGSGPLSPSAAPGSGSGPLPVVGSGGVWGGHREPAGLMGSGVGQQPALLRCVQLPREGIQGLHIFRDTALMHAGASIGVCGASAGAASAASFVRLKAVKGGREVREVVGIGALGVLPCCRLLVVAGDDGYVRICS